MATPEGEYRFWEKQADTTYERLVTRYLDKKLTIIEQEGGDILSKIPKKPTISVLEPRWAQERNYVFKFTATLTGLSGTGVNQTGTLTVSGYLFGEAVASKHVQRILRADAIVRCQTSSYTEMQAQIIAVNGLTATVRAYGNTTMIAQTSSATWWVIGQPWYDTRDAEEPRNLERALLSCGTRRFVENFEITDTAKNISYELISDPVKHELDALSWKLRQEEATAVINERPYYDGTAYRYGTYTNKPTIAGIFYWTDYAQSLQANTNIYVNNSNAKVTMNQLSNVAAHMEADELVNFNKGRWAICANPFVTRRYMNTYSQSFRILQGDEVKIGWHVESLVLDNGKEFGLITDPYIPETEVLIINFDDFGMGFFKGGELRTGKVAVRSILYELWQVTMHKWGLQCTNPRAIGRIYGLPSTYTA